MWTVKFNSLLNGKFSVTIVKPYENNHNIMYFCYSNIQVLLDEDPEIELADEQFYLPKLIDGYKWVLKKGSLETESEPVWHLKTTKKKGIEYNEKQVIWVSLWDRGTTKHFRTVVYKERQRMIGNGWYIKAFETEGENEMAKCRYCEKTYLEWIDVEKDGNWRLYENGKLHQCEAMQKAKLEHDNNKKSKTEYTLDDAKETAKKASKTFTAVTTGGKVLGAILFATTCIASLANNVKPLLRLFEKVLTVVLDFYGKKKELEHINVEAEEVKE